MSNQRHFDDGQFIISYELLLLLAWLCDNEQEALQNLINKALASGLKDKLSNNLNVSESEAEILQQTIVDFFATLEHMLIESNHETEFKNIMHRNMFPAIDHIDSTVCDKDTVALSVEKAVTAHEKRSSRNSSCASPKEVLMKELLKRWKPTKKTYAN